MTIKRVFALLFTLTSLVLLVVVWGAFTALPVQGAASANPYLIKFPLPQTGTPRNLIQHNDALWFTDAAGNAIGRLVVTSTVDYAFTFYPLPTGNGEPYDLAASGNTIWFTERSGNKLGRLDITTGAITEYAIPTANSAPTGIAVASSGVWFVEQAGNKLGRFTPGTNTFNEYPYTLAAAALEDVAASSDGSLIWFTAPGVSRLVNFNVSTGQFLNVSTASPGLAPYTPSQVVLDTLGNPWVSTHNGVVGRYSPATVQFFRWYQVGAADSALDGFVWKPAGGGNQLWFTESNKGFAGQLTTQADGSTLNKWRFPISGSGIYGLVAENDGTIWVADSGAQAIWRWSSPYFFLPYSIYLPHISK